MPEEFDIDTFRKDVLNAMGNNAVALSAFVRLADIKVDEVCRTACIDLSGVPTIHINAKFVEENATTPEHKFVLIYHEILHMILGHGHKLKNKNANIIADALINAMICSQYPQARYTRFFTNFYKEDKFPEQLLRPYSKFSKYMYKQKYRRLYSLAGIPWCEVEELFEDLKEEAEDKEQEIGDPVLLGGHTGSGNAEADSEEVLLPAAEQLDKVITQAVEERNREETDRIRTKYWRRASSPENREKMEQELKACQSQGFGSNVFLQSIRIIQGRIKKRREIEKTLIEQAKQSVSSLVETEVKGMFPKIPLMTVIPNFKDRYAIVSDAMGMYRPFYKNPLLPRDYGVCSIFMDVSGSMGDYVKLVYRVACDCKDYLDDKVYLFSNVIEPISKQELLSGVMKTTGGTDFDIIIRYMKKHDIKKAVIFTDGYASINQDSLNIIRRNNLSIVGVVTPGGSENPLNTFTKKVIHIDQKEVY